MVEVQVEEVMRRIERMLGDAAPLPNSWLPSTPAPPCLEQRRHIPSLHRYRLIAMDIHKRPDDELRGTRAGRSRQVQQSRHGWDMSFFQDPAKVADAIRLVSRKKLWEEVGTLLGKNDADVKSRLKLIVDRRNKIAHEADMDLQPQGLDGQSRKVTCEMR